MKQLLLSVVMATVLFATGCKKQKTDRPNIIFLFADDQCFNTISALGNDEVITPNLDKLVNSGVTFTNAYNMGAWQGAVCVSSRTMFNTGRSVWNAYFAEKQLVKHDSVYTSQLWGNLMQRAGYDTYMAGKWHIKAKVKDCFQFVGTERPGMPNQTPQGYNRPKSSDDDEWKPWDTRFDGFWKGGKHWSEVLGDEAIGFIDAAKGRENPFFMYVAFNAPHDPRQSPKRFVDMYPLENVKVPASFLPEYPDKDAMGCGKNLRDEKLAPFPRTEYAIKVNRQEYYAIISHLDEQIGRIMQALKTSGQLDNTYIFYTADHGLACGNHGLMGKQNMYEHSMKAPLMVIGPDIPKNRKTEVDVYIQDVMASTLDLAGVSKPDYVEFSSLMPLIKGTRTRSSYPAIYGAYKEQQRMIKKGGFKLILYPESATIKLFDLKKDPNEMQNLAHVPDHRKKIKSLFKQLLQTQKALNDKLDLTVVYKDLL